MSSWPLMRSASLLTVPWCTSCATCTQRRQCAEVQLQTEAARLPEGQRVCLRRTVDVCVDVFCAILDCAVGISPVTSYSGVKRRFPEAHDSFMPYCDSGECVAVDVAQLARTCISCRNCFCWASICSSRATSQAEPCCDECSEKGGSCYAPVY